MRTSGFIKLPSDRTLRDYSNVFTAKAGFQDELDKQLVDEIESKALPSYRKFVGIVIDEMKVKEGIVYNKYNGEVIGFTNIGDVNNDLLRLEQEGSRSFVAKYLLVLMVRGTLFNLTFLMLISLVKVLQLIYFSLSFGKRFVGLNVMRSRLYQ